MASAIVLAVECTHLPCPGGGRVEAIDWNPLHWLGDAAGAAAADGWRIAMIGLWSAALWLLKLAFQIIDLFTTPDLTATGPMGAVLPTTLWLGATVAALMMFVQLIVALVRRDGQSIGRVFLGIAQFGAVWVVFLAVAAGLVAAAAGLSRGILRAMLHVDAMSGYDFTDAWPRQVTDTTVATVLGVLSLLLVIPAAFFYILIMFVREAALIILIATAPITAAGLLNDTTKVWFWKSLRWFVACLLISPTAALLLGIGVKLSAGITAGSGDKTAAAAGTAVVGTIMIAIGAVCPLVLFRLLAFVEPGTASGAALRQSWSDAGGMAGVMSGGEQSAGSSAATQSGADGRAGGEATADSQTQSRLAGMLGPVGAAVQTATSMAHRAVDIGSDILGQAGVGSPGYSMTPADERSIRRFSNGDGNGNGSGTGGGGSRSDGTDGGAEDGGGASGPPTAPTPPTPPTSPPPGGGGGLPGGGGGAGGAAGGGAAGGGAEAAVAVAAL